MHRESMKQEFYTPSNIREHHSLAHASNIRSKVSPKDVKRQRNVQKKLINPSNI